MHILIVTGDPIGQKVAGPAIRAWNIATELSKIGTVELVSFSGVDRESQTFGLHLVRPGNKKLFSQFESWADIIIVQGNAAVVFPVLKKSRKVLVFDLYDPMHLENLEQGKNLPLKIWQRSVDHAVATLNFQLARGDFFLCASEPQRLFWLGHLAALGRINSENYLKDNTLKNLIDVVPFGLSEIPPQATKRSLRGVVNGISEKDKIILWSGGLYDWFDPKTLISAVAQLSLNHPDIKLYFMGTKHPHPDVPEMGIVGESRQHANELGVLNTSVFFNEEWVDFDDRANYLLEADLGVSTHFEHLETTFSFRTRILDYLWADLPIVATQGDIFASIISDYDLGIVVPPADISSLAEAIEKCLYSETFSAACKQNINKIRSDFYWATVLQPLIDFCLNFRESADRENAKKHIQHNKRFYNRNYPSEHRLNVLWRVLSNTYAIGGLSAIAGKIKQRLFR